MDRRRFVAFSSLSAGSILVAPYMGSASVPTDGRFVFIIQRGAADGLNIVIPYADPAYAALRRNLAIDPAKAIKLDGLFALHPSLSEIARLHANGMALFIHAVASPYRGRSHFDGQNVLETGGVLPYEVKDGWLNRLVAMMPRKRDEAIALAATVPLALRGSVKVGSYAPSGLPQPSDDLIARLTALYASDPQLHSLWSAALDARALDDRKTKRRDAASFGRLAAAFLTKPDGPRIAMLETGGWDTHSGQNARLAVRLRELDTLVTALRDGLGNAWAKTTVLIATEFGRTAAANGTGGTDHGTASAAMLLGGAVKGGRVLADWPGLGASQLYEGRDLKPTLMLDKIIAGAAAESLGLDPDYVARALFGVRPHTGLVG